MTGRITGISGPTVSVDLKGLRLYDRVFVGHAMLTGEAVKIEANRAVVQVYEDTRGLAVNEPVHATGVPLFVNLGPGLLSGIFDGLQRPLKKIKEDSGPFISSAGEVEALNFQRTWKFHALKGKGDRVSQGEEIGYFEEGHIKHFVTFRGDTEAKLSWIAEKEVRLDKPVAGLDDGKEVFGFYQWPVRKPIPYRKKLPPAEPLITGQRSIDFLFTLARGGTAIMPGGFGTGKTILEQSVAKFSDVDIVIYVGCGERGNEMAEMIEEFELLNDPWTKKRLMQRTILCINTSNMPVAARESSIYTAVTMAEYYRGMGYDVLFLADSISRWAEALREISSSLEEMPGEEGYPTYLASRLSSFIERSGVIETGTGRTGSLTMVLAVSPPGGDFTEPVTQACLRTSGTFLMLDTSLAHRRHFPAVNWFQSYSLHGKDFTKHFNKKISGDWEEAQEKCRSILQKEESLREVAEIIGAEGLQDSDRLLMHVAEKIRREFLCQNAYTEDAFSPPEKTLSRINTILSFYRNASQRLMQGDPLEEILAGKKQQAPSEGPAF